MSLYVDRRPSRARLGRHVHHDSRSLQYLYPRKTSNWTPVKWESEVPVLDQGGLGGCTGFSTATCLGKKPYRETLPNQKIDNAEGLTIYSLATRLDPFPGNYPPNDTGSDGLSAAKAAKKLGLIAGYLHITSAPQLADAITYGPLIVGTDWYESMFSPDGAGLVVVDKSSGLAGGHEYCMDEVTDDGRFGFTNTWGDSFGVGGRFYVAQDQFLDLLLNDKGDATHFVPVTAPAPEPQPVEPPKPDADVLAAYKSLSVWAERNNVS